MKTDYALLQEFKDNEYKIVLQPHEELSNRISKIKKEFAEKYEVEIGVTGKPQITLLTFRRLQMLEERIVHRFKMIAMALPAFKVELRDFGSFPTHSIFVQVESLAPMQLVIKHLKTARPLITTKEQKPHFFNDYYLTIARNLLPWQYEKGWLEYSNKHFTARFIADEMLLLRRRPGEKAYKIIHAFQFMNMPVLTTQGALF